MNTQQPSIYSKTTTHEVYSQPQPQPQLQGQVAQGQIQGRSINQNLNSGYTGINPQTQTQTLSQQQNYGQNENLVDQNQGQVQKPIGEKILEAIPGTKEHKAKKEAERFGGTYGDQNVINRQVDPYQSSTTTSTDSYQDQGTYIQKPLHSQGVGQVQGRSTNQSLTSGYTTPQTVSQSVPVDQNSNQSYHHHQVGQDQNQVGQVQKPIGEKILEAIPGTKEYKAKKEVEKLGGTYGDQNVINHQVDPYQSTISTSSYAQKPLHGQDVQQKAGYGIGVGQGIQNPLYSQEKYSKEQYGQDSQGYIQKEKLTTEKIKEAIPGTKEHRAKKVLEQNQVGVGFGTQPVV